MLLRSYYRATYQKYYYSSSVISLQFLFFIVLYAISFDPIIVSKGIIMNSKIIKNNTTQVNTITA
jgi:hypothetical protein